MNNINQLANDFAASDHFNTDVIDGKRRNVGERYEAIQEPLRAREEKLNQALLLQQFLRDAEDELEWIREKEPLASSTNRGRDLIGVQNLIKLVITLVFFHLARMKMGVAPITFHVKVMHSFEVSRRLVTCYFVVKEAPGLGD